MSTTEQGAGQATGQTETRARRSIRNHPGHRIMVTPGGPFGRAVFECACGIERRLASGRAANTAALVHHHAVGGCNCPPEVIAYAGHPTPLVAVPSPGSERMPA